MLACFVGAGVPACSRPEDVSILSHRVISLINDFKNSYQTQYEQRKYSLPRSTCLHSNERNYFRSTNVLLRIKSFSVAAIYTIYSHLDYARSIRGVWPAAEPSRHSSKTSRIGLLNLLKWLNVHNYAALFLSC